MVIDFYEQAEKLVKNRVPVGKISELSQISKMNRAKEDEGGVEHILNVMKETENVLKEIEREYEVIA